MWQYDCQWDLAAAERSLQRALQSNPAQHELYSIYGGLLDARGKFDEALQVKRRALSIDPTSAAAHVWMSLTYYDLRDYAKALEWIMKAIELDPENPTFQLNAAAVHYAAGEYDKWATRLAKGAHALGRNAEEILQVYKQHGRSGLIRALLPKRGDRCTSMPALTAYMYGEIEETDQAFTCLERAFEVRDSWLLFLKVSPSWDRLRREPRFNVFVRRTGLT